MQRTRTLFFALLVTYCVGMRLLPYVLKAFGMSIDPSVSTYPWNFSPIPATCLLCAAVFARTGWAFVVPLLAWFVGDIGIFLVIGLQDGWAMGAQMAFYPGQPIIYLGWILVVACGLLLRENRSIPRVLGTGVAASVAFYLVTNFAVWAFGGGTLYPLTLDGLASCYIAALPFFRNFLIGTLVYQAVLFSPPVLRSLERAPAGDATRRSERSQTTDLRTAQSTEASA